MFISGSTLADGQYYHSFLLLSNLLVEVPSLTILLLGPPPPPLLLSPRRRRRRPSFLFSDTGRLRPSDRSFTALLVFPSPSQWSEVETNILVIFLAEDWAS